MLQPYDACIALHSKGHNYITLKVHYTLCIVFVTLHLDGCNHITLEMYCTLWNVCIALHLKTYNYITLEVYCTLWYVCIALHLKGYTLEGLAQSVKEFKCVLHFKCNAIKCVSVIALHLHYACITLALHLMCHASVILLQYHSSKCNSIITLHM